MKLLKDIEFLENVSMILPSSLSADGKWSGIVEVGVLGETLAYGDLVYLKAADSRWWKTNANSVTTSGDVKIGMILSGGSAAASTVVLLYGKIRADSKFPTFTVSAPVYIGSTAGTITLTPPSTTDYVGRKIGYGNTLDELYFNPSNDYYTHV